MKAAFQLSRLSGSGRIPDHYPAHGSAAT